MGMPNPTNSFRMKMHNTSLGYAKALKLFERHELRAALRVVTSARDALPDAQDERDARAYNISLFELESLSEQKRNLAGTYSC